MLAEGIVANGQVETVVITGTDTELAQRLVAARVPIKATTWSIGLDPRVIAAILNELTPGALIHAHDNHALTLADAAVRLQRAQLVATRRVAFPIRHPGRWRRLDAAIALSSSVARELSRAGVVGERIHVIPPGVVLPQNPDPRDWPASVPRYSDDTPWLVCIAALTPEKGVDVLIEAAVHLAKSHPNLRTVLLGDGAQRPALQHRINAAGLTEKVILAGRVPRPEVVVCRATLLVQPSRSEGFGSSVLDALAAGVPVVASDTGGLPEALALGGGLLVPVEDPAALAKAIARLLDNPAERSRLAASGRQAAQSFAVPQLVSRTLDVYRSLVTTPSAS
jgi:glycosyltransferase involved in cell wall biosynthesis